MLSLKSSKAIALIPSSEVELTLQNSEKTVNCQY